LTVTPQSIARQRIDKWLWHARMVRTRSAAAALAEAGYVRINGQRISACSHKVAIGDVVTLALDRSVRVIRVEDFCERRGQPRNARALYLDLTISSHARAGVPSAHSDSLARARKGAKIAANR
jgi:ribosome-associated heat shock protein Hsp15